jgi:hypothetical protein
MADQILKVERDPKDSDCLLITLRHHQKSIFFLSSKKTITKVYKGHGRDWYCLPSFNPAPSRLLPLLKAISYSPQFKHLRYQLEAARY